MKKIILTLLFFFTVASSANANWDYVDPTDYKITQQDIDAYYKYLQTNPYPQSRYGGVEFNYVEYHTTSISGATSKMANGMNLNDIVRNIKKYAAIYKYQGPNRKKIDFITTDMESVVCKFYTDEAMIASNIKKNTPTIPIKLPYYTVGKYKVAKNDIPYKPVIESPFKVNYWAGARNACLANGMRLPTIQEFETIYKFKDLYGIKFNTGFYWVAQEISPCYVQLMNTKGMVYETYNQVDVKGVLTNDDIKYMRDKQLKLESKSTTYKELYSLPVIKNSYGDAFVRCIRS